MALGPFAFFLAAIATLHQILVVESCARSLDRSPRPGMRTTTPRVLSFQIGDALFLRLEALSTTTTTTTSTEAPRKTTPGRYTNRYDYVAIEHVLRSPRLMKNFHWCIMGRGPCTSEGSELKRIIPEAIKSDCSKCTEIQKIQTGKVILYLLQQRPDWWKELMEKYDPDGSIRKKYDYEMER